MHGLHRPKLLIYSLPHGIRYLLVSAMPMGAGWLLVASDARRVCCRCVAACVACCVPRRSQLLTPYSHPEPPRMQLF